MDFLRGVKVCSGEHAESVIGVSCVHVCMSACVHVCMCACGHVCMCACFNEQHCLYVFMMCDA